MEHIVVTDGYTLNPGDLTWQGIQDIGKVEVHERTAVDEITQVCEHATIIVTNKTPVTRQTIEAASKLKLIAVTATGYNIVDTISAREKGIPVCNVPGYGTDSVAQHTFALILELANHVGLNATSVKIGEWTTSKDFCYSKKKIFELSGKTIGIVGFGRIGEKVAEIAVAFGMKVIFHNRSQKSGRGTQVPLEALFRDSDVVSLHCPVTTENNQFVNARLLSLMKPAALLINTSRGQLINEHDLAMALSQGKIAGAALDVLSKEPPSSDNPLLKAPNCIITPHNAWLSFEARQRIMNVTIQNIKCALQGHPQNVVN
jgi:glycerate dehydrogenase